jgi:hypothetical protein
VIAAPLIWNIVARTIRSEQKTTEEEGRKEGEGEEEKEKERRGK